MTTGLINRLPPFQIFYIRHCPKLVVESSYSWWWLSQTVCISLMVSPCRGCAVNKFLLWYRESEFCWRQIVIAVAVSEPYTSVCCGVMCRKRTTAIDHGAADIPNFRLLACLARVINLFHKLHVQGGPKKSKPPPIFQKIALKIANEIRFLRKVKVWIKHYNTIRW